MMRLIVLAAALMPWLIGDGATSHRPRSQSKLLERNIAESGADGDHLRHRGIAINDINEPCLPSFFLVNKPVIYAPDKDRKNRDLFVPAICSHSSKIGVQFIGWNRKVCILDHIAAGEDCIPKVKRTATRLRGKCAVGILRWDVDIYVNLAVNPDAHRWRFSDVLDVESERHAAPLLCPCKGRCNRDTFQCGPCPLLGDEAFSVEPVGFGGSADGTTGLKGGQRRASYGEDQERRFDNDSPQLLARQIDQFFRCFRHAPLLAQIGFFAAFGLVAGALIIGGIGAALGLLGSGCWRARWIGAGCILAGLLVWWSGYGVAWWITERYPYSAKADQRCADQASASRAPAHPTVSPGPPAFIDARKIRAWRQGRCVVMLRGFIDRIARTESLLHQRVHSACVVLARYSRSWRHERICRASDRAITCICACILGVRSPPRRLDRISDVRLRGVGACSMESHAFLCSNDSEHSIRKSLG
jgi:hypothetical protein